MKKNLLLVICLLGHFCSHAAMYGESSIARNRDVWDEEKGWNSRDLVTLYYHNSEVQTEWAWQTLAGIRFQGNERVLDFRCWDGKISALMTNLLPQGSVTGVDPSDDMIDFAVKMFPKTAYKNLTFRQVEAADFGGTKFSDKFDLVTSFSAFQLISNPGQVLQELKQKMRTKAKLIMTFPLDANPVFSAVVQEEMQKRGWAKPLNSKEQEMMLTVDGARSLLTQAGFSIQELQAIDTKNVFASVEEMIDWFEATLSGQWGVREEERREFFSDIADAYIAKVPSASDDGGFVSFSMKRMKIIAEAV